MEDKAILLEPDGSLTVGPMPRHVHYKRQVVGLWWAKGKLFSVRPMDLTSLQLMKLALLVDNLSKEG